MQCKSRKCENVKFTGFCGLSANEAGPHQGYCEACTEKRLAKRRHAARAKDDAMRSLGLVKVRGALGGVYWE